MEDTLLSLQVSKAVGICLCLLRFLLNKAIEAERTVISAYCWMYDVSNTWDFQFEEELLF